MKVELHQQGRASVDFLADLGMWSGSLGPTINELMASRGLVDDGLAEDLDERIEQVDSAMADSPTYFAWSEMGEFLSWRHGVAAHEAFEARGGVMDGEQLSSDKVKEISRWPSRLEQLSILSGQLTAPWTKLQSQMTGPGAMLASQIEKKSKEDE